MRKRAKRSHSQGRLPDGVRNLFRRNRAGSAPKTPRSVIAALELSEMVCTPCRAKFGTKESYEQHKLTYHMDQTPIRHKYVRLDGPDYEEDG